METKISQNNIHKLKDRISNLQEILLGIEDKNPLNVTCAIGATINSIDNILNNIEYEFKIEDNGFMSFEEFQVKILDSDMFHFYYQYKNEHKHITESEKEFYMKHIEYINTMFKYFSKIQ